MLLPYLTLIDCQLTFFVCKPDIQSTKDVKNLQDTLSFSLHI